MKRKKEMKALKYFSILVVIGIVLILVFNIHLNPTGNIIETASEITKSTSYIYGNGLVASYDSNGEEKYYINDHLGGTSVVLDKNGNKISEESYYAFGEEKTSGDSRFTYTGKEKDDSGLYYYGARYYDADAGRFTQPDPISGSLGNPQSLNKYVYVLNNPNKYVDPSGMANEVLEGDLAPSPHQDAIKHKIENPTAGDALGTGAFMMLLGGWAVGLAGGALLANPATISEVSTAAVDVALGDAAGPGIAAAAGVAVSKSQSLLEIINNAPKETRVLHRGMLLTSEEVAKIPQEGLEAIGVHRLGSLEASLEATADYIRRRGLNIQDVNDILYTHTEVGITREMVSPFISGFDDPSFAASWTLGAASTFSPAARVPGKVAVVVEYTTDQAMLNRRIYEIRRDLGMLGNEYDVLERIPPENIISVKSVD